MVYVAIAATRPRRRHHDPPPAATTSPPVVPATDPAATVGSSPAARLAGPTPNPAWNGDFSTGNLLQYDSFIDNNPDGNPLDFHIVTSPTPPGISPSGQPFRQAFGATLESGSGSIKPGQAGERTLTTLWPDSGDGAQGKSRAYAGATTWYRDDVYFQPGFAPTQNSDFNWVYELHNYPDNWGDAMLACGIDTSTGALGPWSDGGDTGANPSPERFSCRIFGGGSAAHPFNGYGPTDWYQNPDVSWAYVIGLHTVQAGQWYDMVWEINWDCRPQSAGGQGFMKWWINGQLVGSYIGPTLLYVDNAPGVSAAGGCNQAYLQTGYYRPTDSQAGYPQPTETVYHGATMLGPTAASVGENLP